MEHLKRLADRLLIADFNDLCRRGADGEWRIRWRHIEPIFRAPAGAPPGAPRSGPPRADLR